MVSFISMNVWTRLIKSSCYKRVYHSALQAMKHGSREQPFLKNNWCISPHLSTALIVEHEKLHAWKCDIKQYFNSVHKSKEIWNRIPSFAEIGGVLSIDLYMVQLWWISEELPDNTPQCVTRAAFFHAVVKLRHVHVLTVTQIKR